MAPIPKPALSRSVMVPLPAADPPAAFPLTALGPHISAAATALAERTQASIELVVQHLLTLAAVAAQRRTTLRLPTGARCPASCYFATISDADAPGAEIARMIAACARAWYPPGQDNAQPVFHVEINSSSGDDEEQEVKGEPGKPLLWIQEITPPAAENAGPAFLFARHPLELVPTGRKRGAAALHLCNVWDGEDMETGAAMSLHLAASPRAGRAFLADAELAEVGLLGRVLALYPASQIGARAWSLVDDDTPPTAFAALTLRLTALHKNFGTRTIDFSASAKRAYLAFAHEMEAAQVSDGVFAAIRPLASRLAEYAARLASVIALTEEPDLKILESEHLGKGVALARFYAAEAVRLSQMHVRSALGDATDQLQEWLFRTHSDSDVALRDIYRSGPRMVRDVEMAGKVMSRLERLGVVEPVDDVPSGLGRPRRTKGSNRWHVIPAAHLSHLSPDGA